MAAKGSRSGQGRTSGGGSGQRPRAGGRPQAAVPPATGLRALVVRRTGPFLVVLHRAPRWVPFGLVLGLVLAGALLPEPAGGVALLALAVLLGWLLLLAWPALTQGGRAVRAASLVLVAVLAVTRLS